MSPFHDAGAEAGEISGATTGAAATSGEVSPEGLKPLGISRCSRNFTMKNWGLNGLTIFNLEQLGFHHEKKKKTWQRGEQPWNHCMGCIGMEWVKMRDFIELDESEAFCHHIWLDEHPFRDTGDFTQQLDVFQGFGEVLGTSPTLN